MPVSWCQATTGWRGRHVKTSCSTVSPMDTTHVDVLVIGAGISGIGAAYHLQVESPDRTYLILEGRADIGGTWDLFRYPGRPVRQRHAHPRLRVQAVERREGDRRRPVDHGVPPRDRGRVRHRPPHPVRSSRAPRRVVDRDGDLDRRRRDGGDRRTPHVHVQLPVDVLRLLLVPPRPHARVRRPRPLPGPHRPSAAVAGGSRLRRASESSSSGRARRR